MRPVELEPSPAHVLTQQVVQRLGREFGDKTLAAAMVDRLIHHSEIPSLRGGLRRRIVIACG